MTRTQAQTIRWIYPARRWQVDASQRHTWSSYPILQPVISAQTKQICQGIRIQTGMRQKSLLQLIKRLYALHIDKQNTNMRNI
jgi:hypothetical protein